MFTEEQDAFILMAHFRSATRNPDVLLISSSLIFFGMDEFVLFISESKKALASMDLAKSNLHIVMGNESCDLDSMISTLALAYLHNKQNLKNPKSTLVLPVLNISSMGFFLRTENCYVLNEFNVNENDLIFRDTINLEEIHKYGLLKLSIVDHHILADKDKFLQDCVIEVFDHRPNEVTAAWNCNKVTVIMSEVGSCASLIANEIFSKDPNILNNSLSSLLYDVIAFDTIGFNPKANKVKELDMNMSVKLEKHIINKKNGANRYQELWKVHSDVSHLTPKQLILKDLKYINNLPVPGLPMLVLDYFNLPNVLNNIILFCNEINYPTVLFMGLHVADNAIFRDIAIFTQNDTKLLNKLVFVLKNTQQLALEERATNLPNCVYFKQNNVAMSRKQLLPIIKPVLEN